MQRMNLREGSACVSTVNKLRKAINMLAIKQDETYELWLMRIAKENPSQLVREYKIQRYIVTNGTTNHSIALAEKNVRSILSAASLRKGLTEKLINSKPL